MTTPTATSFASEYDALKVTDRCDRCGARATTRAVLASGLDLLFCSHHARAHEDALKAKAISVN